MRVTVSRYRYAKHVYPWGYLRLNAKCPICGADLTCVEQYKRWYYQNEQKYI